MKQAVMDTVNSLIQTSGQHVPAKILTSGRNSLQVYDVEHWPEAFNSLLLHDFSSLVISIDSSAASLSGFVITLRWNTPIDFAVFVSNMVHILVMCVFVCILIQISIVHVEKVSSANMMDIRNSYLFGENYTATDGTTARSFGANTLASPLTDKLRSFMTHNEL
jgi:hypothetical protein